MFLNFLQKKDSRGAEDKKVNMVVIIACVIAIVFLIGGNFGTGDKGDDKEIVAQDKNDYIKEMEEKLCSTLEKIEGVGEVSVMLIFESDGEKVLATDVKNKNQEKNDSKTLKAKESENDKTVVMSGQGSKGEPIVVEEKHPKPSGIVVVATGAKNKEIELKIYEAVKALYGLPPHRIKVTS